MDDYQQPGFGSLPPELLDELESSGRGEELVEDLRSVAETYGMTMMKGQVFELAAKLAEPALAGPIEDEQAREHVDRSRKGRLFDAIENFRNSIGDGGPTSVVDGLHEARKRRNALAHDFWWWAFPAVMASKTDEVEAQLRDDDDFFEQVTQALFELAFKPGVNRRGIQTDTVANATSLLATVLLYKPDAIDDLHLLEDGEAVAQRIHTLMEEIAGDADG